MSSTMALLFDVAEGRLRDWLMNDASLEDVARAYSLFLTEGPVTVYVTGGESVTYEDGVKQ